jgi:hypothetical protein
VSVVLVLSRRTPGEGGLASLIAAVRLELGRVGPSAERDGEEPLHELAVASREEFERELRDADPNDVTVTYTTSEPGALETALDRAIEAGSGQLLVLPLAVAVQEPIPPSELEHLDRRVAAVQARHRHLDIVYVGPPWDDSPTLEAVVRLLGSGAEPGPTELLEELVARAFGDDWDRYAAFVATLRFALPADSRIVVRGSAVQGESYKSGEPFDSRGPGTSDLDLVLLGDSAMALWLPEAFYLPNVNTLPLDDDAPWVAPALEPTRSAAQDLARRPVAIHAMAPWFLELRSALQGTPYLLMDG